MDVFEGKAWISGQGLIHTCVGVDEGKIKSVKKILKGDNHTIFSGVILPSAFDMHVHFRDPGYQHKEDWKSGSESAAAGGVTAVVDMPNTNPFTSNVETFNDKVSTASSKSVVDFGIGVNVEGGITEKPWFDTIPSAFWKLYPYGVSSEEYFTYAKEVLEKTKKPLVIHGEHPDHMHNEPLTQLSDHTQNRLIAEPECLASMPSSPYLHVAHLSTLEGLNRMPKLATSEVCPHHLLLNLENCHSLDCKVDPPLRTKNDNSGLYDAFREGKIPILSSDHAPHTIEEKRSDNPPSGLPGVETMIPLMLNEVSEGRLELGRLVTAMSEAPADRLGLDRGKISEGQPADLIMVDMKNSKPINLEKLHSKANWTPFQDWQAIFPSQVYRRGELIAEDGEIKQEGGGQNLF
jgi:dihydroorotase